MIKSTFWKRLAKTRESRWGKKAALGDWGIGSNFLKKFGQNYGRKTDKRAALGDWVLTMYRIFLVSLVAIAVLLVSATAYKPEIQVRNTEAIIFAKQITWCLGGEAVVDRLAFLETGRQGIFDSCFMSGIAEGRVYVRLSLLDEGGQVLAAIEDGDSGSTWVKKLFDSSLGTDRIAQYWPGYYALEVPVALLSSGQTISVTMNVEVLVNDEG
jgi:hypothetical protein